MATNPEKYGASNEYDIIDQILSQSRYNRHCNNDS